MTTIEQLREKIGNSKPFQLHKNVDHKMVALKLLRESIPYEVCPNIINGAEQDKVYLCDIEVCLPYLDEKDLDILIDCNIRYDEKSELLYMFV
jgi:hypothetical protein